MFLYILAVGWIPVGIGFHLYFKWKEKRDTEEAISKGFQILMKNPDHVRKILGLKDPKEK